MNTEEQRKIKLNNPILDQLLVRIKLYNLTEKERETLLKAITIIVIQENHLRGK